MAKNLPYLPKRLRNPEGHHYNVWGTEIRGRGERVRKAYAKNRFSRGKPKEYYLNDYYEDPMTYPKDLPIDKVYRIWDNKNKKYIRSKNAPVFNSIKYTQKYIEKQDEDIQKHLEIVPCCILPYKPVPDKKLPSLRKPNNDDPQKGYVLRGLERAKIKRNKEYNERITVLNDVTDQILNSIKDIVPDDNEDRIKEIEDKQKQLVDSGVVESKEKMRKEYTCSCGVVNKFSPWVYAHWEEPIRHTCICGKMNILMKGRVLVPENEN